jgi:hypothetical protein
MRWMTTARVSLIALGVLLLIVIRSIAEVFRIADPAKGIADEQYFYLVGALAAATAALLVLILHGFGRHLLAIGVAAAVVAALFAYKVAMVL